uniref:NADH-ubiquinone oxidoreductase chain 5 n=1 Tax=Arion vulgaris TaxID=1028688 RepID=A0A6C0AAK8_9EUPU|nr:NADH dehydrogenase subunit 5 [Arion vulgaris]QHS71049.1 NADH dehydrogenase subunit 5 [Arion vulgaris]
MHALYSKNRFSLLLGLLFCSMMCMLMQMMLNLNTTIIEYTLMEISSTSFSISFIVDKISLSFSAMVMLIACSVYIFASSYMQADLNYVRFIWILSMFVLSMNILIFAGSFLMLLLGWDGLGITSFALIIYYSSSSSLMAGYMTLLVNRLGDVFIMSSMFILVYMGQFNLYTYSNSYYWLFLLWMLASFTKSAQYPFSAWLPEAMAAPTPVSALVHSSTLVTAGIYLMTRFSMSENLPSEILSTMAFTGSITCLLGGICALYENDVKKVVALSTLSQLGLMMFSLSLGAPTLTLFHLYMHALFKALLFLCVGLVLLMSFGNQDMRLMGGLLIKTPLLSIFFNLSTLCLMGIPFMNAYYTKHVILEMMCLSHLNLISLMGIYMGSVFTAAYMVRLMLSLNWGYTNMSVIATPQNLRNYMPLFILGFMSIYSGKVMISYELSFISISFLPVIPIWLTNLTALWGVMFGLYLWLPKNNYFMSSLWMSNPLKLGLSTLMCPLQYSLSQLEMKWLSPNPLLFKVNLSGYSLLRMLNWPINNMGLPFRFMVIFIFIYIMCY